MSPTTPDRSIILRHLAALEDAVRNLRRHASAPRAALDDVDMRWLVERGLSLAAQNALDVATHVAAGLGRDAADYASAIDALGTAGILPSSFARDFRQMAGFRNVLTHAYLTVDLDIVHDVLTTRLDDFEFFAEHVSRWLATQR